jgi:3-hydroxyisobutyrate dehydrogenase
MLAEGASRGLEMPLVAQTLACFEEASRNGLGDGEVSALPVYWQSRKPAASP